MYESPVHTSNNVEATFDIVAFDNVASILLLVWTGLKQSRMRARRPNRKAVFSLLQKSVRVNVGSRIDGGREFHSFGAQAAKLRGPKLVVRQDSTCRSPRASEAERRLVTTCTSCNGDAQLLEVRRSGLLTTLEDDHAELEGSSLC